MDKIEKIKLMLEKSGLDAVFLFSTKNDSRYSSWLLDIQPLLYHYVCVMATGEVKILEIDYLAESLGKKVKDIVYEVDEENLFNESLKNFSFEKKLTKIGIAGLAPYNHFSLIRNLEIVDITDNVNKFLLVKDKVDIKKISINAKKVSKMLSSLKYVKMLEKTEFEVAKDIKNKSQDWADQESFPTSVMSGNRLKDATAGLTTKNKIKKGDMVCIDCGFYANGVHTDITRMYFRETDPREKIYTSLVKIHRKVIKEVKAGVTLEEISEKYKEGFLKTFGGILFEEGDLGHSIGFGLHEEPIFIQEGNKDFKIEDGMIFTLEPEIKVGDFRYRIEDMVLCRSGKFEILTK